MQNFPDPPLENSEPKDTGTFDDFDEDFDDSEAVEAYAAEVIEAVEALGIPIPDDEGNV